MSTIRRRAHGETGSTRQRPGLLGLLDAILRFEDLSWPQERPNQYLHRWWLLSLPDARRVYLHRYLGSDCSRHHHDHPKTFISVGLRGGYVEEVYDPASGARRRQQYRAPWIRRFKATHTHRLRVATRGCLTLCITGRETRDWGFWTEHGWVQWHRYIHEGARE